MPATDSRSPWAEAIAAADASGDTTPLVDMLFNPRVDVDRVGLGQLLARKVLRPLRPAHIRNGMIRAEYRRLRADGTPAPAAIALLAERYRMDEGSLRPILRRSQRKMRWSARSEPAG